jgi:DNA-binding XRE family transcriptional regulator
MSAEDRPVAVALSFEMPEGGPPNRRSRNLSMKINLNAVLNARRQNAWSQEELAVAAGLNLRTIQRIESDVSASLETKKALASALDLDIHDLDYQESQMPQKWEYKVVEINDQRFRQT